MSVTKISKSFATVDKQLAYTVSLAIKGFAMSNQVKVTSIIRKLYVEHDGKLVEVKQIDNASDYAKEVTIYTKEAVKGATKGSTLYAVGVADFVPKKRTSTKESVQSMLASGMTAEEIVSKLANL